jgi:hypothetical protein
MAYSGTFEKLDLLLGPGWLYFDVTIPSGPLALDPDGKPSDGRLAGYTENGTTLTISWEKPAEEAWDFFQQDYQVTAPHMVLEGSLVQVRDQTLNRYLIPPSVALPDPSLITFGAAKTPDLRPSVVLVFRSLPSSPAAYGYAMIYQSINTATFGYHITRRNPAATNFRFEAQPLLNRSPQDQLGQIRHYDRPPY